MPADPTITKRYRRVLHAVSRKMTTVLSSHKSVLSTKDKDSDALHLRTDAYLFALRPWGQDFAPVGIRTRYDDCRKPWAEHLVNLMRATLGKATDMTGGFMNQYVRDLIVLPLLSRAFLHVLAGHRDLRFLDTFCSEGLYSYYVSDKFRDVASIIGIDLDARRIQRAEAIRAVMGCGANIRGYVQAGPGRPLRCGSLHGRAVPHERTTQGYRPPVYRSPTRPDSPHADRMG